LPVKKTMNPLRATPHDHPKLTLLGRLRNYFLAGVLVTAPIAITFYLTWSFLQFIDAKVARLLPAKYNPDTYLPFSVPGIGLLVAIVFFTAVGWFARNFLGRLVIRASEYVVDRMPVVRSIYGALKQFFETMMAGKSQAFREVVMFEYPRPGIWVIGFVSGTTQGEVQRRLAEDVVNVFLPTTPNPTSGFLLFVPRRDLVFLEMTIEEAIKMVVSAGMVTPPDPGRNAGHPPEVATTK
jgi:uncharacterized membrane protein